MALVIAKRWGIDRGMDLDRKMDLTRFKMFAYDVLRELAGDVRRFDPVALVREAVATRAHDHRWGHDLPRARGHRVSGVERGVHRPRHRADASALA